MSSVSPYLLADLYGVPSSTTVTCSLVFKFSHVRRRGNYSMSQIDKLLESLNTMYYIMHTSSSESPFESIPTDRRSYFEEESQEACNIC